MEDKYFYCYNVNMSQYIQSKGIKRITVAREPKSNKLYAMFKVTPELSAVLNEYKNK